MKNFDLKTIYHKDRPLSWSAIASFEWNPSQWFAKYVAKELPEITPELEFGSMIDKRIQDDPTFLPNLVRYPVLQHEMRCMFGDIPLLGFSDAFRWPKFCCVACAADEPQIGTKHPKCAAQGRCDCHRGSISLRDYKTGRKPWDQKRANDTGQITMYLLMLWQQHKIKPEDVECYIDWLPTHVEDGKIAFIKEGDIRTFKTKRTMKQLLEFGKRIKDTWAAMEAYAATHSGLSTTSMDDW